MAPKWLLALLVASSLVVSTPGFEGRPLRGRRGLALPLTGSAELAGSSRGGRGDAASRYSEDPSGGGGNIAQQLPGRVPAGGPSARPARLDHVGTARWLVAGNSWGVVSTKSLHLHGAPFGNVASFSDVIGGRSRGTPYFYLTTLDPTAADASADPLCSLTLSEQPLGTCGATDPENPLCAKLTLTGRMEPVPASAEEFGPAREGLFETHPEMRSWPADHRFGVYALRVEGIFLIDTFGGAQPVTVEEYLAYSPPGVL